MAIGIGVPDAASSTQTITLAKKSYTINFNYNSRFDFWSFSLYDSEDNVIVEGEKIMPKKEYFSRYSKTDTIGGYLFTDSLEDVNVTRDNFGLNKTHTLTFISSEGYDNVRTV